jgi:hypothetical protein
VVNQNRRKVDRCSGFSKYTAKAIIQQIEDEPESRKEWLLARFKIVSSPQASSDLARVTDLSAFGGRAPTGAGIQCFNIS